MTQPDSTSHRHAQLVEKMMRKQAALGIRVSFVFLVLLIGLPLFNLYYPQLAATPVLGFTLTWLILAVLFFPITWLLSLYFVRESDRIEADAARAAAGSDAERMPASGLSATMVSGDDSKEADL